MSIGHIWMITDAGYSDHLRQANEERAAAFYAVFTALGRAIYAPFGWLVGSLRRSNARRETRRALSSLNDHQLRDIGIWRSEIDSIAQAIATQPLEVEVTLADLRQIRSGAAIHRLDEPQGQASRRVARRPGSDPQARTDQAA